MRARIRTFFDRQAKNLLARDFDALLRGYRMPLPIYFDGNLICLADYADLHDLWLRQHRALMRNRITRLRPELGAVDVAAEGVGKLFVHVDWHHNGTNASSPTRIDYFVGTFGDELLIEMVRFRVRTPPEMVSYRPKLVA